MKPSIHSQFALVLWLSLGTSLRAAAPDDPALSPAPDRAAALRQYDRNGDGHLSDAEREVMRQEVFARSRQSEGARGRMAFQFPPEIVQKYDRDGDGKLNEEEGRAAREGIQRMFADLLRRYDANHNNRIDPEEMDQIRADSAAGKLEGVPKIFLQMGPGRGSRSAGGPLADGDLLQRVDKNHDGRLSAGELQELRAERARLHLEAKP